MSDGGNSDDWNDGYDMGYLEGSEERQMELELKLARYERALKQIAGAESGSWGLVAHAALRGPRVH